MARSGPAVDTDQAGFPSTEPSPPSGPGAEGVARGVASRLTGGIGRCAGTVGGWARGGGPARLAERTAPSLVFLAVRLVGLLVLGWVTSVYDGRLLSRLAAWDGQWLLAIAGGGYKGVPPGLTDAFGHRDPTTALAFFPGYPAAVAAFRFVTGTGLEVAGVVVSTLAGLVFAHGLARLGELVPGGSRRAGLLLVALTAAAPMGVVWSMTYAESLFCACAVWALVGVLRGRWLLAGWCAALAGTIRPTAVALVAAVGAAAFLAAVGTARGRVGRGEGDFARWARGGARWAGGRWRPWVGGLLAPLGLLGYLGFVASRTGSVSGWFELQRQGWNSRFDGGAATLEFTRDTLISGRSVLEVVTVAVLAGGLVLAVICARDAWRARLPWPLAVYAVGVLVMDVGSNGLMNSKARLLLPAFTLLLPVATGLARRRPGTALAVVCGAALVSAWFGGYALTGWPYAI